MQRIGVDIAGMLDNGADALYGDDEVDTAHESAINDVADGLEACAADGPLVDIERIGLLVQPEEEDVAADVKDRVDARREERERERRDGRVHYVAR